MSKEYDITVKIRITVDDENSFEEAQAVANHYASMSQSYKSVSADKIIRVDVEEV